MRGKTALTFALGKFLQEIRINRGMAQNDVVESLNRSVAQSYISNVEAGKGSISADCLNLILSAYKLTEEEKKKLADVICLPRQSNDDPLLQYDKLIEQLSALTPEVREKVIAATNAQSPL